ncbi:hypothetical protein M409DRAFT_55132 [Zasmidium cellare ATCC 36951]|uniref:Uncharacterized protein n=1 Tax=Zasmidium cellare ATCC 36951 TaxID=1080233 RepID=A0A6A6CJD1_ZASCE|nr:uncharacterized protein M409DRAFT_55132 [Zasmidium cellare ATCC 36951]KAF2166280.1 hypothetical protein M409DRAFT_55132 [Zasmidium cellare ATCC 36951]
MGSTATTCRATAPSSYDLDSLQQQLQDMNMHTEQTAYSSSQTRANSRSQQPSSDAAGARLDQFRITLYLSLIPRHLIPMHLFTIDPRTGYSLRKSSDRTVQFLHRLEELWEVADFCEEIVLEALVRSVSGRQQRWGGESELTGMDLESAREMVCGGASGAWNPVLRNTIPSLSKSSGTPSIDLLFPTAVKPPQRPATTNYDGDRRCNDDDDDDMNAKTASITQDVNDRTIRASGPGSLGVIIGDSYVAIVYPMSYLLLLTTVRTFYFRIYLVWFFAALACILQLHATFLVLSYAREKEEADSAYLSQECVINSLPTLAVFLCPLSFAPVLALPYPVDRRK